MSWLKNLFGKKEPEPATEPELELPPLPPPVESRKEEPEVKDFVEIGGSPVPGLTLRHVLRGHTKTIGHIAQPCQGD